MNCLYIYIIKYELKEGRIYMLKVLGVEVSGCRGVEVSRYQGFKVSRCRGIKVSRYQGIKVSRYQGFKVSGCQGFEVSRFQGIRVSRYQGVKVSRYQGFKVCNRKMPVCRKAGKIANSKYKTVGDLNVDYKILLACRLTNILLFDL